MTLYLHLSVKFRAFGITFGSLDKWFTLTLDVAARRLTAVEDLAHSGARKTLCNDRGVLLEVVPGF